MLLDSLVLRNFRNYSNQKINVEGVETIFLIGENGQGKTNFLEAIYYLSYGTSFRTKTQEHLLKHNEEGFYIKAEFKEEGIKHSITARYKNKKKEILFNENKIQNTHETIEVFPSIIFKHSDIFFVVGGPEYQRMFLDQTISLVDFGYLKALREYKRCIHQKNMALKTKRYDLISTYNKILTEKGLVIIENRRKAVLFFSKRIESLFSYVFTKEAASILVSIEYKPNWRATNKEKIFEELEHYKELEKKMSFCCSGPHRDRLFFGFSERPLKTVASTGQIRLFSLILRVLQAEYYTMFTKKKHRVFAR